ncbi:MAG: sulfate adenylyltransferase, partial [Candidatus Aminicenantes bacterium]|nr:sulfate adenylyltransferase [Candidatus Aminicenantes bacterium]
RREAELVFGTADPQHPGVDKLARQGDVYLGGPVEVFHEGAYARTFPEFARPSETRAIFADKGWSTIAAFQTRNPIHRSHEHLTKLALEICDGLFIHPVVGKLKPGDIPAGVRMKCYRVLLDLYYPKDRVIFKVYPLEMRYAGPREALLHAIIRQNFGCTHIIIGRDHAGVGRFYGPFDAHRIFDAIQPGDLRIRPIKLDTAFWCYKCEAMASPRTCPHTEKDHLSISGTELRDRLSTGVIPPTEFSRQEVLQILRTYYRNRKGRGR